MLLDSMGEHEEMPDWSEASNVLFGAGLTLNPSELHGAITGLLGAGFAWSDAGGRDRAVALIEKALSVDLHGDLVDFSQRTLGATRAAIMDTDYGFQPLLPDDTDPIDERLTSLGQWAQGFLSGFTQAVSAAKAGDQPLPDHTAEALRDFAAIAQVDPDEEASEDADRQLEELIEYCRVAAISVVHDAQQDISG